MKSPHGSRLAVRGGALLLLQTDGFGADQEAVVIRQVLSGVGGALSEVGAGEAADLIELRRHSRGDAVDHEYRVGEDVAVPKSRLVDYIEALEGIAKRQEVHLKVVAHAGDGNLHPTFWVSRADGPAALERLGVALDESVRVALEFGGTITGEHGVGQYKLRWLP